MAKSVLRAALLALALAAPVANPALAQELTAQEQLVLDTLPAALRAQILALPAAERQRLVVTVATVKANVAAGNVAGVEAAIATLAQVLNAVPQSARAALAVAVATDVARSVEGAPPAVRQAASQAVTGAAGIAANPAIVGAGNVISDAVLQQITQVAEAVLAGVDVDEVIAAVEAAASPTG